MTVVDSTPSAVTTPTIVSAEEPTGPTGPSVVADDLVGPVARAWLSREAVNGWPSAVGGRFVFDVSSCRAPDGTLDPTPLFAVLPIYSRRFRQRIVWIRPGIGVWQDNHRMQPEDQLSSTVLGDDQALDDLTARQLELPLDPSRPLWDAVLVDGLPEGHVALTFRVHEALSDGTPPPADWNDEGSQAPSPAPTHWEVMEVARRERLRRLVGAPRAVAKQIRHVPAAARAVPGIVASRNPWMGAYSGTRYVHSASIPIDAVRAVKERTGQRVGDILVAIAFDAVARGLAATGRSPRTIGAMTMVADVSDTGRSVSAWFINVPRTAADLDERAMHVADQCDRWRDADLGGGVDLMSDLGMTTWGRFGRERRRKPLSFMAITNVGSFSEVWAASPVPMVDMHLYGMIMPGVPLNFALVGSPTGVQIGLQADRGAVPCCEEIGAGLDEAIAAAIASNPGDPGGS